MTDLPALNEADLAPDPIEQFARWYRQAEEAGCVAVDAMTVATATPDGAPSVRMVLLRGVDVRGFTFFTNYESRKGRELTANPRAALLFHWAELHRQVRITGSVSRVSDEESDTYFRSRPPGSRAGAWVSRQSETITSREDLDRRYEALLREYGEQEIPRPPFWGGLRITPETVEFWQSRPNRLHDRLRYRRGDTDHWLVERLSP
jgi:pyridoxamine 5'-phosphate oxidase